MMQLDTVNDFQAFADRLGRPWKELDEIPDRSSPQELEDMLESNWDIISIKPKLSRREAAWLFRVAEHPVADKSVKKAVLEKLDSVSLGRSAEEVDFDVYISHLRRVVEAVTPPVSGGTTTTPPETPVLVKPQGPINPLRYEGKLTFPGPFQLKGTALSHRYNGAKREDFGTTTVQLPGGGTRRANDMVYDLGDGTVGMRIIPVNDDGDVRDASGHRRPGHELMDKYLREQMDLGDNDLIFSLIPYLHPEEHIGDLAALGTTMLKTEMGMTHLGCYVGNGRTTNSPMKYHDNKWGNEGYPANVQIVSLQGVSQATLNRNMLLADQILNKDVTFPGDYKNDKFRTIDLNTTLMFYRDWIRKERYLRRIKDDPNSDDESWWTYCAEHKTIVVNVGLNVPHNVDSFRDIFGDNEGQKLWGEFKIRFNELNGHDFSDSDETHFEPLWKKEGLSADKIRPFPSKADYDKYDAARHAGDLNGFSGFKPLAPGEGMAWVPETTADLLNDFLETYVPMREVGGPVTASSLMGFKDTVKDRLGIDDGTFLGHAVPIINKIMVADAMIRAEDKGYLKQAFGELYAAFGGNVAAIQDGSVIPDPKITGLVVECLGGAKDNLADILADSNRPGDIPSRRENADSWLKNAVEDNLIKARQQAVSDPTKVQFYSPPAVTHRAALGMHEMSSFVNIRTVCTAIASKEIKGQ